MSATLEASLTKEGYAFNFFQAIRLLEHKYIGAQNHKGPKPIQFIGSSSLCFPSSDIKNIAFSKDSANMTLTFMGLQGVASPLPAYMTEKIASGSETMEPFKKLLEIFEHRIYDKYYKAWKKSRPLVQGGGSETESFQKILNILSDRRASDSTSDLPDNYKSLALAGRLLFSSARSAQNLSQLIRMVFGFQKVKIIPFVKKWIANPSPLLLGSKGHGLGYNALLGQKVCQINSNIIIRIEELSRDYIQDNLSQPSKENLLKNLKLLVTKFLRDPIDFKIEFRVTPSKNSMGGLGHRRCLLGRGAWLGSSKLETFTYSPSI